MRHRLRLLITLCLCATVVFTACAKTSGESMSYSVAASGSAATPSFTNSKGWNITLTTAKAIVGPVYIYSSAPQASLFLHLLGGVAYACPADAQFDKGSVLGQIQRQVIVDLLALDLPQNEIGRAHV